MIFPLSLPGATVDTVFADRDYPKNWGFHTGWDANLHPQGQGGDSDLGLPILAMSDGIVKFVSDNAGGLWGGLIVIHHPQIAPHFYSRYGHHKSKSALVSVGQQVQGGQQIAGIGKGKNDSTFVAHLHFDFFRKDPPPSKSNRPFWAYWPAANKAGLLEYFADPRDVFKAFKVKTPVAAGRSLFRGFPFPDED